MKQVVHCVSQGACWGPLHLYLILCEILPVYTHPHPCTPICFPLPIHAVRTFVRPTFFCLPSSNFVLLGVHFGSYSDIDNVCGVSDDQAWTNPVISM